MNVASRTLRCNADEIEMKLNREAPRAREYLAGCDMVLTEVLCSDAGCRPARPKPPCTRDGCFAEDPMTLEWRLTRRGEAPAAP